MQFQTAISYEYLIKIPFDRMYPRSVICNSIENRSEYRMVFRTEISISTGEELGGLCMRFGCCNSNCRPYSFGRTYEKGGIEMVLLAGKLIGSLIRLILFGLFAFVDRLGGYR